jgi:acetyl esterase/lipase
MQFGMLGKLLCFILPWAILSGVACAGDKTMAAIGTHASSVKTPTAVHLQVRDTLGDVLRHPAFSGFAPRLLPRSDRSYDPDLPLTDIGSLLPYHTHVNPDVVVGALNRLIDDATAGHAVFYEIYTPEQQRDDPALTHTGLFFFRGHPDAPFCVIAPGGGFSYVGSVHEGFPYAREISARGYNAFVVQYRVGQGGRAATEDLATALAFIFRNAKVLHVSTEGYSLWGSSAGARMAAAIGTHGTAHFGGPELPKPATVVMAYTGHSEVGSREPPTFAAVGERDGIAPPSIMKRRTMALRKGGVAVEFHEYPGLAHGFGSGAGTAADGWINAALAFWLSHR